VLLSKRYVYTIDSVFLSLSQLQMASHPVTTIDSRRVHNHDLDLIANISFLG
jgi:hypothetical protein